MSRLREPRQQGGETRPRRNTRPHRASAERLFELARHLTERDREAALYLYRHRVLTTDQLQLLFFSSRRRAQDRLLFLYRNRVLDRFYPARPFGSGKPVAHWLLDEAGALLVSAMLGVERKQLGWQRRDDWGSHPQLAHQLETNRFVTDLIAATLTHPWLGVSEWWSPAEAAQRLGARTLGRVLPDAGIRLETSAGPIECYLEWDRGTETQERLAEKLLAYRRAEARLSGASAQPRCILVVVPGERRLETLRRAYRDYELRLKRRASRGALQSLTGVWPLLASTAIRLRADGPLASVWERLDESSAPPLALTDLPARGDLSPVELRAALGRRWHKDDPDFWSHLSPFSIDRQNAAGDAERETSRACDREADASVGPLRRRREADLAEAGLDTATLGSPGGSRDLRSPAIDGSMDDAYDDFEEEPWQ